MQTLMYRIWNGTDLYMHEIMLSAGDDFMGECPIENNFIFEFNKSLIIISLNQAIFRASENLNRN